METSRISNLFEEHKSAFSSIIESKEFYFQRASEALDEWKQKSISQDELDRIIKMEYQTFLDDTSLDEDIRDCLFTLIAFCDQKAKDKDRYNSYDDKRTIAHAGIRQNAWVVQLCKWKKDEKSVTNAVAAMINFIQDPTNRLPIISDKHRQALSVFWLNKEYDPTSLDKDIIDLFSPYCHCSNSTNNSTLISRILYTIKDEWLRLSIRGLVARDRNDWPSELAEEMNNTGCGIAWWQREPVKGIDTIKQLRNILEEEDSFDYYIVADNKTKYCLKVVDFSLSDQYEQKKEEWKEKNPAWFEDDVDRYESDNQKAAILFLISEIKKTIPPIPIDNFTFYDGASPAPLRCITPFTYIQTQGQKAMLDHLSSIIKLLRSKKNIILQGAPGTGKTYMTAELAVAIVEGEKFVGYSDRSELMKKYREYKRDSRIAFTTFHQSMDYENFIEGLVPEVYNGQVSYSIKDGIFKRVCEEAKQHPDDNYVVIIDEINRGSISKIFGELITLIEHDKRLGKTNELTVSLPYSKQADFGVPNNLYIIGTMNTTDRSTGSIDYALRRRFVFKTIKSDHTRISNEPAQKVYNEIKAFIEENKLPQDDIEDLMVGHSYFMTSEDCYDPESEIKQKIEFEVIPLLKEYIKDGILTTTYEDLKERATSWIELMPNNDE